MPHILHKTIIRDVIRTNPRVAYVAEEGCWWTTREEDIYTDPTTGVACDPRRSRIAAVPWGPFLYRAQSNPAAFGKHGLDAFIAAYHGNCIVNIIDPRPTALDIWQQYNDAMDRMIELGRTNGGKLQ